MRFAMTGPWDRTFRHCRTFHLSALILLGALTGCSDKSDSTQATAGAAKNGSAAEDGSAAETATSASEPAEEQLALVFDPATVDPALADMPLDEIEAFDPLIKGGPERVKTLQAFALQRDRSVVPALIELMRARAFELVPALTEEEIAIVRYLTGKSIPASDWRSWREWTWREGDPKEHKGYPYVKYFFYKRLNPLFSSLLDPKRFSRIRWDEIVAGPSIRPEKPQPLTSPKILGGYSPEADYISNPDPVIGVSAGGEKRAYPIRLLNFHEVVNDTLGGIPIVVFFNPLTQTATAYVRDAGEDKPLVFGSTSLLYRGDGLYFDQHTKTLWTGYDGRAVSGSLSEGSEPTRLRPLFVTQTSWVIWRKTWRETTTIALETSYGYNYANDRPYDYFRRIHDAVIPLRYHDSRLHPKERVFGLALGDDAIAYPIGQMYTDDLINDHVDGKKIVIQCFPDRDEYRAYRAGDRTFHYTASPFHLSDDQTYTHWRITEEGLEVGSDLSASLRLERVRGEVTLWYSWVQRHPNTRIYTIPAFSKEAADSKPRRR